MQALLDTTPKHYITGMTALNIPAPEGTGGDWHFYQSFSGRGEHLPKIFKAGEGEPLNTNPILGDYGVYECSNILREYGLHVPKSIPIYAANHYRATLDLLYQCIKLGDSPEHLRINDWFDNEQQKQPLLMAIKQFTAHLSKVETLMIDKWLATQN